MKTKQTEVSENITQKEIERNALMEDIAQLNLRQTELSTSVQQKKVQHKRLTDDLAIWMNLLNRIADSTK